MLRSVIEAYGKVQPNLARHEAGFPTADALAKLVVAGQDSYGMAAVGEGRMTPGAEAIVRAADVDRSAAAVDLRLGRREHARAGVVARAGDARRRRTCERVVDKLRVYTISDQDDAGPWLRREFPTLHYIATPGDTNDYHVATWTGIAGDEFYRNGAGADFTTVSEAWVDEHMRKKGPLGAFYPLPCCIIEGDTPSFLGLMNNGLGVVHESDVRRMGRPLRLAAALARDAAVLDQLARLARHRRGHRRQELHVRPGDDLAVAARRFSTTSPRAWTGPSRTSRRPITIRTSS